jgi:hypothetical protein
MILAKNQQIVELCFSSKIIPGIKRLVYRVVFFECLPIFFSITAEYFFS